MTVIEKDVEAPTSAAGRPPQYPFSDMEVGDSIFFEGKNTKSKEYLAAQGYARYNGKKFTGRQTTRTDGRVGLTIWRVS